MSEPLIICENLVKIYQVAELEVVALQGLDLTVEPGELMGIVGASGSGKTTLLNMLGGLDHPSAGRLTVDGRNLLKLSNGALDRYRRIEVGFVWQQTGRNLIPYLSARENVELPMTIAGVGLRAKRAWSQELLEATGLWEHRKHRLAQLSGGQQQRVAIAVALANRPRLLLADEPTGELDSATAQGIMALLRGMNTHYGLTTLIVTHDPGIARTVDRVVTIRDGRTSSETVRRVSEVEAALAAGPSPEAPTPRGPVYEEYVVIDAAGRLQVPPELREQADIGDRATLEVTDKGILIRPVAGRQAAAQPLLAELEEEEEPPARRRKGLRRWLGRR
jgi:ABC-type lipoprotein export system ATPase subunit/bifunctional DNA-binding transcriptional regulator/antitoxin component of YhaV-PrlF toxin-antitoxin module